MPKLVITSCRAISARLSMLPRYENIAIFALDSGSWFKFTPLVGRILSDLAINGRTPYDISPFSALRAGIVS